MKKFLVSVAMATVLVSGLVAWRAHERAAGAWAHLQQLNAERASVDEGIAAMEAKLAVERNRTGSAARGQPILRAAVRPNETAMANPAKPDTALSLEKFPGVRALFERSVAGDLALRYRTFYSMAKLTPEQIRKFERVMTEAKETKMDFELAARAQGFDSSDPAVAKLRVQGESELTGALTEALGPDGYQKYQQYQRMEPLSGIIGDMATIAVQHDAPLTAAQADRLMTTIANASATYQSGGNVEPLTVNWSQVIVEAKPYLTATQFAVLQQEGDMQQVYVLLKQFYANRRAGGG